MLASERVVAHSDSLEQALTIAARTTSLHGEIFDACCTLVGGHNLL